MLRRKYGEFSLTAMTYSAALAKRKMASMLSDHCYDQLEHSSNVQIYQRAHERAGLFFDYARNNGYGLILASEYDAVVQSFYYIQYFKLLCLSLEKRYGRGDFIQYSFLPASAIPGSLLVIQRYLDLVLVELQGHRELGRRDKAIELQSRGFAHSVIVSWLINNAVKSSDERQVINPDPVDLLILALEESDRRSQSPLVDRLVKREISLKWCCVEGNRMAVSQDERALEPTSIDTFHVHRLPQSIGQAYTWKWPWARRIITQAIWSQTSVCLNHASLDDDWSPLLRWRLAGMLARNSAGRAITRKAIADIVDRYQPKVAVMSSVYGAMSVAQAYLEERDIPLVRLPHGVEDVSTMDRKWQCEAVGRFGQVEVDQLKLKHVQHHSVFHTIGSYHLGKQVLQHRAGSRDTWSDNQLRIIYPISWGLLFFPDTQLEIEHDLTAIGRAAKSVGAHVEIRCHPRQREWDYYDYEMMRDESGDERGWDLSDGSSSLVEAINASHIILIRTWSGSSLQALYAEKPVVAWMPRSGKQFSDHVLSMLPCRARNGVELSVLWRRLIDQPSYREQVVQKQKALLEYIVSNPCGDPYEGAEKLVVDTMRKVEC